MTMTWMTERALPLLVLAAAAALLAALALQFLGGLPPCPFCVYQRYPYLVVIAVGVLGLWLRRPRAALALAALALAVDVGLAGYHVGIEEGWFALPESCAAAGTATTIEELRRQLEAAPARCDQVPFTFAGLSLAGWNALYAAGLLLFALWALLRGSAAQENRHARIA
jgi:disulfide bond formation protein DsbB